MRRQIFCERWCDLPFGERVMMASCGGKNNVSIQGSERHPTLFRMQASLVKNLLPLFSFCFICLARECLSLKHKIYVTPLLQKYCIIFSGRRGY